MHLGNFRGQLRPGGSLMSRHILTMLLLLPGKILLEISTHTIFQME
jgi:hypothetical protein